MRDGLELIAKVNKDYSSFELAKAEAGRLASFKSRHIVKYYDSFTRETDDGEDFIIIMELCNAGDLEKFIESRGGKEVNLRLYLRIIKSILEGVNVLHSNRQLHRDLDPKNIFLSGDLGKVKSVLAKLGDFGLAIDVRSSIATEVSLKGKVAYFSPE